MVMNDGREMMNEAEGPKVGTQGAEEKSARDCHIKP
jgi:hypothetical protein